MKKLSLFIAAALAVSSFAAGAAGQRAPIQLSDAQMEKIVAGSTPDVTGAGLCTSLMAGGSGGAKFAELGNPSINPGGPQSDYRGFGQVGYANSVCGAS